MLYINNSAEAQKDGTGVLNKNLSLLQSKKNYAVLDVGCGPGNFTYEKILPLLPNTTTKIVGVDVLGHNIEYARKHYQMDPRISYRQLDIQTDQIPEEYIEGFDLVLSFYCLHFVRDQRKAFNNIYNMLKPGGRILISIVQKLIFPDMYTYVYNHPKWKQYMGNYTDVVLWEQPDGFYKKLLEEIGFEQFQHEHEQKRFSHSKQSVFGFLKSLNLFNVPSHLEDEFIEDQMKYFENNGFVESDDDGEKQYFFPYIICGYNLIMDKPMLYINNSAEAQKDGTGVLNKNLSLLQSKKNYAVLDVGCGPGNFTYEKILPLLPNTTTKIVGVDVLGHNIEYAGKHYQMDPRISYRQLDIQTDQIPEEYIEGFDLVLSFYCLHFVRDQRKAFNNIYNMLKPGGRILISIVQKLIFPDMYTYVHNNPKWKQYMGNYNDVVLWDQPDGFYKKLLEEIGFEQFRDEQEQKRFSHSKQSVFGFLKSLNLFNIPSHLENEFIEDQMKYFENNGYVESDDDGEKQYFFPYIICKPNLTMERPLLYVNNSFEAQASADYALKKNLNLLQNNNNRVVLDVGCGPGNVTYNKLLPLLPSTTKKIIGVDISQDNIEYASKYYQTDPRVSYKQLDILTDTLPTEFIEAFDLILSLSCLHYVGDHRKALNNIYKMLKPDGKIIITFVEKSMLPNIYQYVYNNPKWSKYMSNFNNAIHVSTEQSTKKLIEEVGFKQIQYEQQQEKFLHLEDSAFDLFKSLNLFNVPENLEKEFIQNHLEYLENNNYMEFDDIGRKQYYFPFTTNVISASI
ncbi:hypothetical protein RN001_014413 [Aquatica leii]|uniref:Methyltransferase domain-containing protein n=1 Tax=Aquatica leii TaxID=1421715 RepID=A0AAN7SBL7_9COLE|nr:hypothetical protein RN001_014413 [Aquatica leii]